MEDEGPQRNPDMIPVMVALVAVVLIIAMTCLGLEGKAPWQ